MRARPSFRPRPHDQQRVRFSGQADRPDRVFNRIGVELEPPVIEEARQPLPMIERVADVISERRAAGDHRQLFLEPRIQRLDEGSECFLRAASLMSRDEPRAMASVPY